MSGTLYIHIKKNYFFPITFLYFHISEEHKYEPLTVKDFSGNDKMINAVFELSTL